MYNRSYNLFECLWFEDQEIQDRVNKLDRSNPKHHRRIIRLNMARMEFLADMNAITRSELQLEDAMPLEQLIPCLETKYRHWLGEIQPLFAGALEE